MRWCENLLTPWQAGQSWAHSSTLDYARAVGKDINARSDIVTKSLQSQEPRVREALEQMCEGGTRKTSQLVYQGSLSSHISPNG